MDELLIEMVRKNESLYNVKSKIYRDQNMRQTAWEEIGKHLKISANDAKERWDKLRRCFCNARNRRRDETKSGMIYKKKNSWKYESQMDFLTPFMDTRKTHSNLNQSEAEDIIAQDVVAEGSDKEETAAILMEDEHPNLDAEVEQSDISESDDTPETEILQILKENSDCRKKKYKENTKRTIKSIDESMDEMDMFFLSMSRMTKKLPKVLQAEIKLGLSNAVLSAEMKTEQQRFFQPPDS